jgi:LmbE family N-acetylglucosaminyl deacetylase
VSHLFVAPHSDDVALSCGGLLAKLHELGEDVTLTTIFCGPGPLPELTPYQREALGFAEWPGPIAPADVMGARGLEDAAFAAAVGAKLLRANEPDAVFRGYESHEALGQEPRPGDPPPVASLVAALDATEAEVAYIPLSVGGHVDHRLVHRAGVAVLGGAPPRRDCRLVFYEDVPYSVWADFHGLDQLRPDQMVGLSADLTLEPEYVELSEHLLERKIAGIRAYPSQVEGLFGSEAEMVKIIRKRAADVGKIGGVGPAERYWRAVERYWRAVER